MSFLIVLRHCGFILQPRKKLPVIQNKLIRFVLILMINMINIILAKKSFHRWTGHLWLVGRIDFKTPCYVFNIHTPLYLREISFQSIMFTVTTPDTTFNPSEMQTVWGALSQSGRFSIPKVKDVGKRSFAYRWMLFLGWTCSEHQGMIRTYICYISGLLLRNIINLFEL